MSLKRSALWGLVLLLLCSCSTARYAMGPQSRDIEALEGYRGTIQAVEYTSSEKNLDHRRMVVYLPENYESDTLRRFPVFYLLHGARGNEITWVDSGKVLHRIDSLRMEKKARDFILVMPNMNNYFGEADYKNGHCVNAMRAFWLLDGEAERHFMHDVVKVVDSLYRTVPDKSGRAIAGMSSGGLQAIYLSANAVNSFDYVGLFSPYTYPTFSALGHMDVYGRLWKKLGRQFAEPPALYAIYIGRKDVFRPHIYLFDQKLSRKGYPHWFTLTGGGHEWYNWIDYVTDFCQKIFPEETQ